MITCQCKSLRLVKNWHMVNKQICIVYHHTVSPLKSRLIPAGLGPPLALPIHMKTRDVFFQSGIAMDLFWHMLLFHWIPVNHLLKPNRHIWSVSKVVQHLLLSKHTSSKGGFVCCPWLFDSSCWNNIIKCQIWDIRL